MKRSTAFIVVGVLGFVVQIAALAALTSLARWSWLPATIASVELALVHNFCWHDRWTWRDRGRRSAARAGLRFLKFHAGNGAVSLAGNAAIMTVLVGGAGIPPLPANVMTVVIVERREFPAC